MPFSNLMLSEKMQRNIKALGYSNPTPIQKRAIPILRKGRDILASSQTGTGKSASFIFPLLENLPIRDKKRVGDDRYKIDALILAPTRELVVQINNSIKRYSKDFPHKSVAVYGGVKLGGQVKEIRGGANIVVATTGQLLKHIKNGTINLSEVKMFVIDEADKLLEMGFIDDVRATIKLLPKKRQSAMFSATFPSSVIKLAKSILNNPVRVEIEGSISAKEIKQSAYYTKEEKKVSLLIDIIKNRSAKSILVFVNSKRGANLIVEKLTEEGIRAVAIHGDKSQSMRDNALKDFKEKRVRVLVATDVVARGIDIKNLPLVINFELPIKNEEYIHRVGRTGRAENRGEAISLVSQKETAQIRELEKLLNIELLPIEKSDKKIRKTNKKDNNKLKKAKELAEKMMSRDKKSEKIKNRAKKGYSYFN